MAFVFTIVEAKVDAALSRREKEEEGRKREREEVEQAKQSKGER